MKACPDCGRLYPEGSGFCPLHGSALCDASEVPIVPDAAEPRLGQILWDRYQIRRVLADGGMGRVYEGLDLQESRGVALKILHPHVAHSEVALERFRREFEISRELPHEHIVEVLDFRATGDGSYALVMEFLYGEELRATLKRERVIAPARLVRLLAQVAIGLDPIHARGYVHRDLKPDNLFLCQSPEGDRVRVLDFGSAKASASSKKLTALGTTIGSPFYMAPEQAQGLETLDHRADVWAMAAIVYECVTGVVPFPGTTGPSTLLRILTTEPEPPSRVGGSPYPIAPALDAVLALALRKVPGHRTATLGALADGVGRAYGLYGSHGDWALLPEAEIARRIAARANSVALRARRSDDPVDRFFGAPAALADAALGVDPSRAPSRTSGVRGEGEAPIRIPTENRYAYLLALAAGAALLALGVALLAFLR